MADQDGNVQVKVRLEPQVHEQLRVVAFDEHVPIADIVREGIGLALARRRAFVPKRNGFVSPITGEPERVPFEETP